MKVEKNSLPWYFAWFFYPMAVLAIGQCLWTAIDGQLLGSSTGIRIGGYRFGAISHYLDPFLLSSLILFYLLSWRFAPPCKISKSTQDLLFTYSSISLCVVLVFLGWLRETGKISMELSMALILLYVVVFPGGYRGAILSSVVISLAYVMVSGLAVSLFIAGGLYAGKLTTWLIWNFLKGGSQGVRKAIQERSTLLPGPPTGDSGTSGQEEIVHVDISDTRVCES